MMGKSVPTCAAGDDLDDVLETGAFLGSVDLTSQLATNNPSVR